MRQRFASKLHKGLHRGIPNKCLPLDFMGFYALAALDSKKNFRNTVKYYMITDISKRREYIRSLTMNVGGASVLRLDGSVFFCFFLPVCCVLCL